MHIFVKSQTIPKVRRETVTTNETFTGQPCGRKYQSFVRGRPMQTITERRCISYGQAEGKRAPVP